MPQSNVVHIIKRGPHTDPIRRCNRGNTKSPRERKEGQIQSCEEVVVCHVPSIYRQSCQKPLHACDKRWDLVCVITTIQRVVSSCIRSYCGDVSVKSPEWPKMTQPYSTDADNVYAVMLQEIGTILAADEPVLDEDDDFEAEIGL